MRTRYLQDALTGHDPYGARRHECKTPCTGRYGNHHAQRKLFGFWNPEHAKPHVVRRVKP